MARMYLNRLGVLGTLRGGVHQWSGARGWGWKGPGPGGPRAASAPDTPVLAASTLTGPEHKASASTTGAVYQEGMYVYIEHGAKQFCIVRGKRNSRLPGLPHQLPISVHAAGGGPAEPEQGTKAGPVESHRCVARMLS